MYNAGTHTHTRTRTSAQAEAESVTFNAGYAFEVIYLLLAIPACWVAYNFADRMRRAKDAGAPPNHVALLGCLTAPGCNAAANATTGTIPVRFCGRERG